MDVPIDHLRGWVGREERVPELLTPQLVQRYNATFDREGPLNQGADAPLLIHHSLCRPAAPTAALAPDGA